MIQGITMKKTLQLIGALVVIPACLIASSGYADSYYRWKDENGQIHYGSRPPQGVEAVKIKTYGGGTSTESNTPDQASNSGSDSADGDSGSQSETAQRISAERKQQCDNEKQRLSTLESSARIRMKNDDGSTKYLSPEEQAKEISTSKEFLKNACQ